MKKYLCWYEHGELYVPHDTMVERMVESTSSSSNMHEVVDDNSNHYKNMIMDTMRMNYVYTSQCLIVDEEPNTDATRFFDLLKNSNDSLWDGYTNHSKLSVVAHVFNIKSDHELSEAGYNRIVKWTRNILPERNRRKDKFYDAKSMMKPLGLGYQKIDMCPKFCMLYYLENTELIECRTCEHSRYIPLIGRERLLSNIKNLDTSQSHLNYSCHQCLLTI
jgi:hypothetical protein